MSLILRFCWLVSSLLATIGTSVEAGPTTRVVYDEAKQGDLRPVPPTAKPLLRIQEVGVAVIRGHGRDSVDDGDAFVFTVSGERPFDCCVSGDAAEFKKLRAIKPDGTIKQIAFGSTNPAFGAEPNIHQTRLPPGTYHLELYFGPGGAAGNWVAKIAPTDADAPTFLKCNEATQPFTQEKMPQVNWPGLISIFHGHNWGKDEKYLTAIQEAGFGAAGATEWQINQCAEHGLKAFVFIWPHEAGTIPAKHQHNPNVLCYYLSDRIRPAQWATWAAWEKLAFAGDPQHPAIFTIKGTWGGIDRFCTYVKGRAMEFYHYRWDGNRRPELHYAILEQFRKASLANGDVPVCRIVETRPEDIRKTRQTFYSSLAYGVRAFRMGGAGIFDAKNRDQRGVPTRNQYGDELKSINAAIRAYSPVFVQARCQGVYHVDPLPAGCPATPQDAWVTIKGQEVLVGLFEVPDPKKAKKAKQASAEKLPAKKDRAPSYLLVANRDAFHSQTARLSIQGSARLQRMDKTTGNWVEHPAESIGGRTSVVVELDSGSGELLQVVRTAD